MSMSTIADQIACVKREIGQRERVYPRLIAKGTMSERTAKRETETMRDVLATLEGVQRGERLI